MTHKGYIFDIKRYAIHDGPGIRTTVFFKGCPLRCLWCHNPESFVLQPQIMSHPARCTGCAACLKVCKHQAVSIKDSIALTDGAKCTLCAACIDVCPTGVREIVGTQVSVSDVMKEIYKDLVFFEQSGGGVTFSGGEPLAQPDFLIELLAQSRKNGIHTAVDTSCHATHEILSEVAENADLFLCDLKHLDPQQHKRITGVDNQTILKNITWLGDIGKDIIIRIPIIPGYNDDLDNIKATGKFISGIKSVNRIEILPYNSGGVEKSARLAAENDIIKADTPTIEQMARIADILKNFGINVTIG